MTTPMFHPVIGKLFDGLVFAGLMLLAGFGVAALGGLWEMRK